MGYTHYWYKEPTIAPETFRAIVEDFSKLILPMHDAGLPLAGSDGSGEPELTPELVAFNGVANCGHPENHAITIPWPTKDGGGLAVDGAEAGQWFAGVVIESRTCDGSCDYESFVFEREQAIPEYQDADRNQGRAFNFCKTAFRPYDIAVTAFLIVAKKHLGNLIKVSTDGEDANWFDGKMLCETVLGYGLGFEVVGRELLPVGGEPPYVPKPKPVKVKPVRVQTHPPENIRRNALRKLAAIILSIKEATCYSLDDHFHGRPCDLEYIKRELRQYPTSRDRLTDNGNGTFTLHCHSNLWFELEA